MSWSSEFKFRLQFFAIFLAVMCPGFLIWQAAQTRRQIASSGWPSVQGEVIETTAKFWLDHDNKTEFFGRVVYRCTVDGAEHTTDLTDLGPGSKRSNAVEALADVQAYKPGTAVTVYYDPADPSVGIIEKGVPTIHLLLLIGLSAGTLVGWVAIFFYARTWIASIRANGKKNARQSTGLSASIAPTPDSQMGDCVEVFRPMMANTIAGFIITALLVVGGVSAICFPLRAAHLEHWNLPFEAKTGWSWLALGLFVLIGIMLLLGAFGLGLFCTVLLSYRVEVCRHGFRWRSGGEAVNVLWSDVIRFRETILHERPPILKGPAKLLLPKIPSTSYTIVTKHGGELGFDGDTIKDLKRFGEILREQARRLSLPWETVEKHA